MDGVEGSKRRTRKATIPNKKPTFGFTLSSFDDNDSPQRSQSTQRKKH